MSTSIGRGAAVIASLTVLSRLAGFGRILVLTWAVGIGQVLDVYNTASRVPNILYEIVAGGALASLVIPLLAAPLARREPEVVNRTASGLLTWTLLILTPMAVIVAFLARPIMSALAGSGAPGDELEMGARMIAVFAPQLPLYGVGIVLTGILQTHRRFAWPALAPLLSSLTVMLAYTWYAMVSEPRVLAADVSLGDELILSIGTTSATVVMSLCLLIPLRKVGFRFRPTLRFGPDVSGHVKTLAIAGAISTGAWQLALLLILNLTNGGPVGTVAIFTLAQTLFMLPWGVLAVPLATSAYPELAEAYGVGDTARYSATLARTTRVLLLLSMLGAAALVGLARPFANVFEMIGGRGGVPSGEVAATMTETIAALGPGLVGFALFALLTRALYAAGAARAAAVSTAIGFGTVYIAAIVLSEVLPVGHRGLAVAAGHTLGVTVLGGLLMLATVRRVGRSSLSGTLRSGVVGLVAAVAGAAVGWWVTGLWGDEPSLTDSIAAAVVGGVAIAVVFGLIAIVGDARHTRPLIHTLWTRIRR